LLADCAIIHMVVYEDKVNLFMLYTANTETVLLIL